MLYAILGHDGPAGLAKRKLARAAHLEALKKLQAEGRLVLAGPRPRIDADQPGEAGFHGSLIVAEFDNLEAAQTWAKDDPYAQAGVFERVDVFPFVKVLPA